MLRNKSGAEISIKYNGIDRVLKDGEKVDVRDFDISSGQTTPIRELIPNVEKRLLKKYAGSLEQVPDDEKVGIDAETQKEIAALKEKVTSLEKQLLAEKKIADLAAQKNAANAGEINEFGGKEAGYKAEIKKLKKELEDQEEEHKAHIKRIMGK